MNHNITKRSLIYIISIVSTLIICGFTAQNIAISSVTLTIVIWIKKIAILRESSLYAINNPKQHNPQLIAQALDNCLLAVKSSGEERQLVISNPGINKLTIQSNSEGGMNLHDSHRTLNIDSGDLWIPDHPLPLELKAGEYRHFSFIPAEDGRIHVSTGRRVFADKTPFILIPIVVILFFFDLHCAAAALTAPIIYMMTDR